MLAELDAAGYLLAVATGKVARGLARALAQQRARRPVHATRCADEGLPKPHPDMLLHLMDATDVAPASTLMIGDTTHDLELARNAGAAAVAVAYGAHRLRRARAARTARDGGVGRRTAAWLRANG